MKLPLAPATSLVAVSLLGAAMASGVSGAQRAGRQDDVRTPNVGFELTPGWQLLVYDGCHFAVPGWWRAGPDAGSAHAPDGSSVSVRAFRITSWSEHKAQIRAVYGHVNVLHEDSARRLWFEIGDAQTTQHYIDVAIGLDACAALLEIRGTTAPDTKDTVARIADSIGPVSSKTP